jgi:hypothetical protein
MLFSIKDAGSIRYHVRKTVTLRSYFIPYPKINSRLAGDLDERGWTTKLLQDNIEIFVLLSRQKFLNQDTENHWPYRERLINWATLKFRVFVQQDTFKEWNGMRQRQNSCDKYMTKKKELRFWMQNSIKWEKNWTETYPREEDIQITKSIQKKAFNPQYSARKYKLKAQNN